MPKERTVVRSSNLHVVINTNISMKKVNSQPDPSQYLKDIIYRLKEGLEDMKKNIHVFAKPNQGESVPELKNFTFGLEIGPKMKMLHVDGNIGFSGFSQLDSRRIQHYFNHKLEGYSKGTFCHVSFTPDNLAATKEYSEKDGMKLI